MWMTARRLHGALGGRALTRAELRVPRFATADLTGLVVREVVARGKHLLTRFDDGRTLHVHLGMEGSWRVHRPDDRRVRLAGHQVRAVLANPEWECVGLRLAVVELVATAEEASAVGPLGPDLLGPDWDEAEALRRLGTAPQREIGIALVDQRNLAGIGNLYKAESLFLAGVSPWTAVCDVSDLGALVRLARRLLTANRAHWQQTTTGSTRRGDDHWVFEREGRPCRRCGGAIASAWQGEAPQQRITYWCPHCQPGPTPSRWSVAPRASGRASRRS